MTCVTPTHNMLAEEGRGLAVPSLCVLRRGENWKYLAEYAMTATEDQRDGRTFQGLTRSRHVINLSAYSWGWRNGPLQRGLAKEVRRERMLGSQSVPCWGSRRLPQDGVCERADAQLSRLE